MSLATLTSKELAKIQKLVERKEALTQQIVELNSELESIESGASSPAAAAIQSNGTSSRPAGRKSNKPAMARKSGGRTARGQLKDRITAELKSAGKQGRRVKDLAGSLGTSYGNITAFFQSTGKKIKEIKKVGRGQYAWTGA
jgi:hypothetical protein